MAAIRFLVRGSVQGVGYRAFVRRAALRLGLVGWARNLPDGRVEVLALGEADALTALGIELARGPATGRVHAVEEAEPISHVDGVIGFEIR